MSIPAMRDMVGSPAAPARLLDHSSWAVPVDFPCRTCSYNLRAQPITSRCPECGTSVTSSIDGALVNHAERAWLAGVIDALNGLFVTIIVAVAARLAAVMAMEAGIIVVLFIVIPAEVVLLTHIFNLVRRPVRLPFPRLNAQPRQTLQFCFVISFVGSVLIAALPWIAVNADFSVNQERLMVGFVAITSLAWMVGWFLLFFYFAALAAAIPHASTERFCKIYQIVTLLGVVLVILILLAVASESMVVLFLLLAAIGGVLIMGVLTMGMLIRLKRLLRRELEMIDAIEQGDQTEPCQSAS